MAPIPGGRGVCPFPAAEKVITVGVKGTLTFAKGREVVGTQVGSWNRESEPVAKPGSPQVIVEGTEGQARGVSQEGEGNGPNSRFPLVLNTVLKNPRA